MEDTKKIENETVETENIEEAVDETVEGIVEEEINESKFKDLIDKTVNFVDKHKGKIVAGIVTVGAFVVGKKLFGKDSGVTDVIFADEAKEVVDAVMSEVAAGDVVETVVSEVGTE